MVCLGSQRDSLSWQGMQGSKNIRQFVMPLLADLSRETDNDTKENYKEGIKKT